MDTSNLPESVRNLLDRPKQWTYAVGLLIVVVVAVVLVLTVLRVQNQKTTVTLPQAAGCGSACTQCILTARPDILPFYKNNNWDVSCNNQDAVVANWCQISPTDCAKWKKDACSSQCSGTGGTGGTTQGCNSSSPADVQSCYKITGSCSGAWACHNKIAGACPSACSGNGSGAGTLIVTAECGGSCAGLSVYVSGPTAKGSFSDVVPADNIGQWANKQTTPGDYTAKLLDKQTLLDTKTGNLVGGGSLTLALSGTGGGGKTCTKNEDCTSGQFCVSGSCMDGSKTHIGCVAGTSAGVCTRVAGAGNNDTGCTAVGGSCQPSVSCDGVTCPSGQSCFAGACKAFHLGCTTSGACAKLEGAGANKNGCTVVDQWCGGQLGSCWGNGGSDGRCMDCNADGVINVLDFSCFACNWQQKFTPDQNPSCASTQSNTTAQ